MKASIICIGTELVTGKTRDTNSYYLAKELERYGVHTQAKFLVEDDLEAIVNLLELACKHSEYILLTGGLGPTLDDLTREAVAAFTGFPLELREEAREHVLESFRKLSIPCPENNLRQAYVPKGSTLITNHHGTAPGFMTIYEGKKIIALPGPPQEMTSMWQEEILPHILENVQLAYVKREVECFGIGESALEDKLLDLIRVQKNPIMATYASAGKISLLITAWDKSQEKAEAMVEALMTVVRERLGNYIYSEKGEALEEVVHQLLLDKGMNLAVAESCTGGQLAARLTSLPGISAVFHSGYVTYSNAAKMDVLGVSEKTLELYGAVSHETALEMVQGLVNRTKVDAAISITGVAGPGGGTEKKPVGLVYVGVYVKGAIEIHELRMKGDRQRIQNLTVLHALNYLRKGILNLEHKG